MKQGHAKTLSVAQNKKSGRLKHSLDNVLQKFFIILDCTQEGFFMLHLSHIFFAFLLTIGISLDCHVADILPRIGAPYGESRPRARFVQDVLGITETAFAALPKETHLAQMRAMAGRGFHSGEFTISSLADLREAYQEHKDAAKDDEAGSFYVIVGNDPMHNPLVYKQIDTGSLQAHWGKACERAGKRLTVMVASNSNGLETLGYQDIPTDITRYIHDHTQGPAASISAAPGTLLRNYLAFEGDETPGVAHLPWRQNANQQLNFLEQMLDIVFANHQVNIPVSNGYLAFRTPNLAQYIDERLLNDIATTFENNPGAIQVGVHTGVTVSHGLSEGNNHRFLNNAAQRSRINQVFCAGLDLGQGTNLDTAATRRIAKVLLETQVEATLRAAYINNTDIVVLSMLGCGAFGNNPEWLIHAIELCQELIEESGMRVVLNLFSGNNVVNNRGLRRRLLDLARQTDGAWLEYSQEDGHLVVENILNRKRKAD